MDDDTKRTEPGQADGHVVPVGAYLLCLESGSGWGLSPLRVYGDYNEATSEKDRLLAIDEVRDALRLLDARYRVLVIPSVGLVRKGS